MEGWKGCGRMEGLWKDGRVVEGWKGCGRMEGLWKDGRVVEGCKDYTRVVPGLYKGSTRIVQGSSRVVAGFIMPAQCCKDRITCSADCVFFPPYHGGGVDVSTPSRLC